MATFRVKKNHNYTVMSNYHLQDNNLSLKAKGLMSVMLSLPDNWEYSISGLAGLCKEKECAIKTVLDELKKYGYVVVNKLYPANTNTGRIEYIYDIYENPNMSKQEGEKQEVEFQEVEKQEIEIQGVEIQGVEIQAVEKQPQQNTNIPNTNILNTNIPKTNNNIYIYKGDEKKEKKEKTKKPKSKYGEYQNVLLTDDEYKKLKEKKENAEELIDYLDKYIERLGYKAKSHYLCCLGWVEDAVRKQNQSNGSKYNAKNKYINTGQEEYNDLDRFYS